MKAFSHSTTPETEQDRRGTPIDVFQSIQKRLNLNFVWDVCADSNNKKVNSFWSKDDDALSIDDWGLEIQRATGFYWGLLSVWMNPPYSAAEAPCVQPFDKCKKKGCQVRGYHQDKYKPGIYDWTKKAASQSLNGLIIVGLVIDDRSANWWKDNVESVASLVLIPDRRISFLGPDGKPQSGNPKPSAFPVWTPWRTDKTEYVRFELPGIKRLAA